jgi:hypothetical protein
VEFYVSQLVVTNLHYPFSATYTPSIEAVDLSHPSPRIVKHTSHQL